MPAVAAFSAALTLVSAVAAYAINRAYVIARQAERIEEEYRNTLITQSRYLAEKSGELLAQGDRIGALQVALAALPEGMEDDSRPLVTEALYALNNAVYPYHVAQPDEFLAKWMLQTDGDGSVLDHRGDWQQVSPQGTRWMISDASGQLYVFDMETAERIAVLFPQLILPGTAQTGFLSADFISENRIVVYMESCAVCWDLASESRVWLTRLDQNDLMGDSSGASQSAVAPDGQSLVFVHTGSGQCTFYRLSAGTGEITAVLTGETPARGAYHCRMALSPSGDRVALGFAEYGFRTGEEEDEPAFLMLADFSGGCRTVAVEYTDVAALTFLSDDQLCVFTVDTSVAGYTHTDFDYAIACYDFQEGSPVWSTSGRTVIDRPVGDEATPTCSVQLWRREFTDGSAEELLVAQFAGRLLLLLPSDGTVLRTADFAADILCVYPYSAGQLYLALRDGRLMVYLPVAEDIGEMGSVTGVPRGAAYDRETGAFLLALEDSQRTVVLSNQLEDPGIGTVELNSISSVEYAAGDGWEYRIVLEDLPIVDEAPSEQRLLFYRPLEQTPVAVTDAGGQVLDLLVIPSEDGGEICYYLLREGETVLLRGWSLERDQMVLEAALSEEGTLPGNLGNKILYLTPSTLELLGPDGKSERSLPLEDRATAQAVSPDGKYLALITGGALKLLDLEQWAWVPLEQELTAPSGYNYAGSLAFSPDSERLAVWTDGGITILDLAAGAPAQTVEIACRSCGYSLFLNDRVLLVYGDAGHLTTWDLENQAVVMEDPNDDLFSGSGLALGDGCFLVGTRYPRVYDFTADGRIARRLAVDYACVSPSGSEILCFYNSFGSGNVTQLIEDTAFRIYPMYTLDELVAKGQALLDGRTLTEAERIAYFIDG